MGWWASALMSIFQRANRKRGNSSKSWSSPWQSFPVSSWQWPSQTPPRPARSEWLPLWIWKGRTAVCFPLPSLHAWMLRDRLCYEWVKWNNSKSFWSYFNAQMNHRRAQCDKRHTNSRSLMPAVAPRQSGVWWCLDLGMDSKACSKHFSRLFAAPPSLPA